MITIIQAPVFRFIVIVVSIELLLQMIYSLLNLKCVDHVSKAG